MSNETKAPRPGLEFWDKLNALPRFAFLLSPSGNALQKFEDKSLGNWIDVHEAQTIVDQAQERISDLRKELDTMTASALAIRDEWRKDQQRLNAADQRIDELGREHGEEFPPCDYCGTVPDYHPWHGAGLINGEESPHIHACTECRHKLPTSVSVASRDDSIAWLKRIDGIGQNRAELIYSMGFRRHSEPGE